MSSQVGRNIIESLERRFLMAFGDDLVIFYSTNRPDGAGIYTANNDGSNVQKIDTAYATSLENPRFNSDETRILFSSNTSASDDSSEIFITDADGSNLVQLTDNDAWDGEATWTPDGDRVVFSSERDGNQEIYIMNADGSNPVRLTNDPGIDAGPFVHPSGGSIIFHSDRSGDFDIHFMNIDGSAVISEPTPGSQDYDGVFSPNGRDFAFVSDRDTPEGELYLASGSSPELLRVTQNSVLEGAPTFSPDGQSVASIIRNNTPGALGEIWISSLAGTNQGEVAITEGFDDTIAQWASAPEIAVRGSNDSLTVWGTGDADSMSIAIDQIEFVVTRGGRSVRLFTDDVDSINVFLREGGDTFTVDAGVQRFYCLAGPGDDKVVGGDGNDTITGGAGRNTLFGGNGNDRLNGSNGRDFLYGDGGNDRIYGNAGNDYILGGANVDRMWGGDGDDFLSGNGQNDKLFGEGGFDQLFGGDGNDFLDGGPGGQTDLDTLNGQAGSDSGNGDPADEIYSVETF